MNKDLTKSYRKAIKDKIKQQWSSLTVDDVPNIKETFEELESNLQKKIWEAKRQREKKNLNFN